jgi:hypothetical protein
VAVRARIWQDARRMSLLLYGIAIAAALCMAHAATSKRWDIVRGGAPVVAIFVVLALVVSAL